MALMYEKVKEKCGDVLIPIMITCDPARDTPEVLKEYLAEFHPSILGLTGSYENVKQTCKEYRVYFSTPPTVKPGQDYLVDHSIYFYLMGTSWLPFPKLLNSGRCTNRESGAKCSPPPDCSRTL
jgi:protein SCO1/2